MTFQPVPEPKRPRRKHLTKKEWSYLLASARASCLRDHALIRMLYECGMRAAEPGKLLIDHCKRLDKLQIWIVRGKKRKTEIAAGQWMDVSTDLAWLIHELVHDYYPHRYQRKPSCPLFPGKKRHKGPIGGISRHVVYETVHDLGVVAGIAPEMAHPHAIRHAVCQHLYETAEDNGERPETALKTAARIVGHSAARTTLEHYIAETGAGKRLAAAVLQEMMQ